MDLSSTPRARFPRKKFANPAAASPYRSPLMHSLPEKKVQSPLVDALDELKTSIVKVGGENKIAKDKQYPQQKFISPVSTSSPFRSPFARSLPERKVESSLENATLDELKQSAVELWNKNNVLLDKIHQLEQKGCKEEELKWYIDQLHRYNEVKDIAQQVMGRIAILEQKTIKEVHQDFGMTEDD